MKRIITAESSTVNANSTLSRATIDAASGGWIGLDELHGWTLLAAAIAYWGNGVPPADGSGATTLARVVGSVLEHGAFTAAAWAMIGATIIGVARGSAPARPASPRQVAASVAICLLCAAPTRQAAMLALVLLGLRMAWPPATRSGRIVATLLFGLAIEIAWTSTYFLPLHVAVGNLDALAVRALLGSVGIAAEIHNNVVDNLAAGFAIEILAPCASSFPLAGVGLAFMVTTIYRGRLPRRGDVPWLAASLLASIALTEIRLAWMALGEADYMWLHYGGGVTAYTLAAVGLAVLFPMLATRNPPSVRALA